MKRIVAILLTLALLLPSVERIIDLAVAFWFDDEDWSGTTKVWDYFRK